MGMEADDEISKRFSGAKSEKYRGMSIQASSRLRLSSRPVVCLPARDRNYIVHDSAIPKVQLLKAHENPRFLASCVFRRSPLQSMHQ